MSGFLKWCFGVCAQKKHTHAHTHTKWSRKCACVCLCVRVFGNCAFFFAFPGFVVLLNSFYFCLFHGGPHAPNTSWTPIVAFKTCYSCSKLWLCVCSFSSFLFMGGVSVFFLFVILSTGGRFRSKMRLQKTKHTHPHSDSAKTTVPIRVPRRTSRFCVCVQLSRCSVSCAVPCVFLRAAGGRTGNISWSSRDTASPGGLRCCGWR